MHKFISLLAFLTKGATKTVNKEKEKTDRNFNT